MDAGKGCLTRGGGTAGVNDKTIINQMMLRFRPIAPKPATDGSVSGGSTPENKISCVKSTTRAKRKYVRVREKKRSKKDQVKPAEEDDKSDEAVVTLQLLPEHTGDPTAGGSLRNIDRSVPIWLNFNKTTNIACGVSDRTAVVVPATVVESWVTVEDVTEKYMDGTDVERMKNLGMDTCPTFVSDGLNRVQWVNEAYKRMVGPQGNGETLPEVMVRLVVKEELPIMCPAFACRVRVQYTGQKQKNSQTMPCDVWRIDFVGFAWRLDVKAALRLGR
ncbi:uncharacterized protein LOC132280784 isoform X1 [Cornus florida]|uniref:uncharacterized protein LOC132280784 isoform X1 n=1 Tax=Cornus florida TaxID=4283 RepID=UPI00289B9B3A|nr:uncharacterized protein LOC132280784 isoform X1 [Cornus florida]